MIIHEGSEWVLKSSDGSKVLGKHKTKEEAEAQERAIQVSKHADGLVMRFDRAPIASAKRTQEGFLKIDGSKIARTGVQIYRRADGTEIRELREPEQVFDAESMKAFGLLPLTNAHPPKMLSPDDVKRFAVGAIGPAQKLDEKWLSAPISVWDQSAIDAIEAGRMQLSVGYSCRVVDEPGEWNGEKYDCKQVGIVPNHLALVDFARAGSEARLKLDGADAESVDEPVFVNSNPAMLVSKQVQENKRMPHSLKIDGMTFEVNDPNAQTVVDKALASARKDAEDKLAAEKVRADAAAKSLAEVQAKHDSLEAQVKTDADKLKQLEESLPGRVDGLATERAKLWTEALSVLGANEKLDGKGDTEIKTLVIQKLDKDAKLDGKGADYINTRYQVEMDRRPKVRPIDVVRTQIDPVPNPQTGPRADEKPSNPEDARQRMINNYPANKK